MPTILGMHLLGGLKPWRNKVENLWKNSLVKFAGEFAGNFPKFAGPNYFTPNPLCRASASKTQATKH